MASCQKSSCSGVWWWSLSVPALVHTESRFPLELEWAQDSFSVLSPQDISVCTFSYPLDIKGGALLYSCATSRNCSGTTVSEPVVGSQGPSWELSWLGPVQPWSVACVVFFFFPFCSKSVNSPCPWQEVQGAEPALPLRPLLFECSCRQRRHPKPHPSQSCWAWICLPCFNSFSKADLQLSSS